MLLRSKHWLSSRPCRSSAWFANLLGQHHGLLGFQLMQTPKGNGQIAKRLSRKEVPRKSHSKKCCAVKEWRKCAKAKSPIKDSFATAAVGEFRKYFTIETGGRSIRSRINRAGGKMRKDGTRSASERQVGDSRASSRERKEFEFHRQQSQHFGDCGNRRNVRVQSPAFWWLDGTTLCRGRWE